MLPFGFQGDGRRAARGDGHCAPRREVCNACPSFRTENRLGSQTGSETGLPPHGARPIPSCGRRHARHDLSGASRDAPNGLIALVLDNLQQL